MSTLLEQAIVDAKSLKEAALKNAEHALLEKYSEEMKSAVETLLEAEGDEDPLADMGGMGEESQLEWGVGNESQFKLAGGFSHEEISNINGH